MADFEPVEQWPRVFLAPNDRVSRRGGGSTHRALRKFGAGEAIYDRRFARPGRSGDGDDGECRPVA